MTNHFETFPEHSPQKPVLFRSIYEKLQEAPENSKKFQEIGLEFSPDGYIATIKKQSIAESQFSKTIEDRGDEHYKMDLKESMGQFYVFAERQENKADDNFDLAA